MTNDGSGQTSVGNAYQLISVRATQLLPPRLMSSGSRLGIMIEPSKVRLLPRPDNPYTWKVLSEKQALFSKNLSDHSIGAYKELGAGVGETFEVVPTQLVADPVKQSAIIAVAARI